MSNETRQMRRITRLCDALRACGEQFNLYVQHHARKDPPDAEKMLTNLEWEERCRVAIESSGGETTSPDRRVMGVAERVMRATGTSIVRRVPGTMDGRIEDLTREEQLWIVRGLVLLAHNPSAMTRDSEPWATMQTTGRWDLL